MAISMRRGLFLALTVMFVLIAGYLKADDSKPKSDDKSKITIMDAKAKCKEQGKAGADLVQCVKDAQGEKK